MANWEDKHREEIESFAEQWRGITKSKNFFHIAHTNLKLGPNKHFILQHRRYEMSYIVGKTIDTVLIQHYKKVFH